MFPKSRKYENQKLVKRSDVSSGSKTVQYNTLIPSQPSNEYDISS